LVAAAGRLLVVGYNEYFKIIKTAAGGRKIG
jgi:hypothetical protein